MRRTLTIAAAAAALLLAAGPLPVAEAGGAAQAAVGRWSAREAQSFWTAERMASALPLPPVEPAPAEASPSPSPVAGEPPVPSAVPSEISSVTPAGTPSAPAPVATPTPTPPPTPTPTPKPAPAAIVRPVPARPAPAGPGIGQDFGGVPVVGRMFAVKGGGAYFCTASVVASPGRNLVLSAAHCLLGSDTQQVAFVPLYTRANPQPYGIFPVLRDAGGHSKIWIDPRYRSQGPDRAAALDVAFAQVGPDSHGFPVQDVVGGNRLVTGAGYAHAQVTLIGYPASAARPRLCVNRTTKFTSPDARTPGSFLRIDCTGYPGGTSGGPFLTRYDTRTGTGDVVGVIGGWKTGGDTADTSYSSYFGTDIRKLYEKAVAGAKAV
ncbi:trypsin-like peptidase domain-containing protein [Streptomyces sp. NPDC006463]|uniref:trypsin-like peptidase domain-containing protein n=1 Tax=Streptomyces sp. NPDC006463 TaxID=3364746 RepID=UPI00368EAB94